jgi:hypothetical protein
MGKTELALRAARRRIEKYPDEPRGHAFLGRLLLDIGRLEPAATAYASARALEPENHDHIAGAAAVESALEGTSLRSGDSSVCWPSIPGSSRSIPTCTRTGPLRGSTSAVLTKRTE